MAIWLMMKGDKLVMHTRMRNERTFGVPAYAMPSRRSKRMCRQTKEPSNQGFEEQGNEGQRQTDKGMQELRNS